MEGRKHLYILILAVLSFCPSFLPAMSERNLRILSELDQTISQKAVWQGERETRIRMLKNRLHKTMDPGRKYLLCDSLFIEYLHYQADSSLHYLNEKAACLAADPALGSKAGILINRSEVLGVMGMYFEALQELHNVNVQELEEPVLAYYYGVCKRIEGWMADYTPEAEGKKKYLDRTDLYRDSVLKMMDSEIDQTIMKAERLILHHQADSAVRLLTGCLEKSPAKQQKIYVYYTLSDAYDALGDVENRIYWLAQTAILDLKTAVREYAALQRLARLLYEQGDLERAYRYLNCSMEDAVACNARLRFLEVTEFYPIIDRAYVAKETPERLMMHRMLLLVSVLAVMLIVLLSWLWIWMRKLSAMRKELYTANRELQVVNDQLEQTGKIKEVYIVRYLERCVSYLEKLEHYRRLLEKLAMASKIDELFKMIRSEQFLRDERKKFYGEFDKSFLDLFPNFVEDFNLLLVEDGRIYPKPHELLNTELRIFALIRLGVTDTTQIAHFLGYSLATVYSYRSKMRNRAKGDKDHFEQDVMKL